MRSRASPAAPARWSAPRASRPPPSCASVADLDVTYGQGFGLGKPQPPWASVSSWVSATLSRRGLRSFAPEEGAEEADEAAWPS